MPPRRRKEATSHNDARKTHDTNHTITPTSMSSNTTRATDTSTSADIATDTQASLPGLPLDVFKEILRSVTDPIDLARLRAVNRAMRDAVAATGREITEYNYAMAACLGHVSTLQHKRRGVAYDKGPGLGDFNGGTVLGFAARGGHVNVMKWLHADGCSLHWWTFRLAAEGGQHKKGGNFEALKWLHANGCPWNKEISALVAGGGYLEIVQWLGENGCSWDAETCAGAAKGGSLEILQWLRANGCPWDETTIIRAEHNEGTSNLRRNGHDEIAKWAVDNVCPKPTNRACCYCLDSGERNTYYAISGRSDYLDDETGDEFDEMDGR